MPCEPLVCVWEAANALSGNTEKLTVSLIKEVTSKLDDLSSVVYSEKKFRNLFACFDQITFVNYKAYVHSALVAGDVPLQVSLDQIQKKCWEISYHHYFSKNTPEDVVEMLWLIFNRFADENTYPVVIQSKEINFIVSFFGQKLKNDNKNVNALLGKNATFNTFLKIVNSFVSRPAEIDVLRSVVSDIHEKFVKHFVKWGWMHMERKFLGKFTWWKKYWFVLTNESLSYYGESFLTDPSGCSLIGKMNITSNTKLQPLPKDDILLKSYIGCFKLSSGPEEIVLSCESDIERRFWMEIILEAIQTSSFERKENILPENCELETNQLATISSVNTILKEPKNIVEIEEEKLKVIFMKLDKDGNGVLEKNEFFNFFSLVGMSSISKENSNKIFESIDTDKSGKISFDEFVKYFEAAIFQDGEGDSISNSLRSAFLSADRDGSGTINVKEYIEFMWEQKRGVAMSKLMKALESIQTSSDGELSYKQFQQLFENENSLTVLPQTESSENNNMNKMLKKLYDDTDAGELAEFLKERWNTFSSFKRKGASGEVVMSSPDEMVADFTPGNYSLMDLACFSDLSPIEPKHTIVKGVKWVSSPEPGKSGKCIFPLDFDGKILCDFGTNETLRYYSCSFANNKQEKISLLYRHGITDFLYANKYLDDYVKLQNGGSGIEKHEFSHLDCPMEEDSGYFILGKMIEDNEIHLTAFHIPILHALYVPGNVIHSNDYLKGKWRTMLSDEVNIDHVHLVQEEEDKTKHFTFTFTT